MAEKFENLDMMVDKYPGTYEDFADAACQWGNKEEVSGFHPGGMGEITVKAAQSLEAETLRTAA
jgi:hypothetical protein